MLNGKRIAVLLPAYNAELTLVPTYEDIPHSIVYVYAQSADRVAKERAMRMEIPGKVPPFTAIGPVDDPRFQQPGISAKSEIPGVHGCAYSASNGHNVMFPLSIRLDDQSEPRGRPVQGDIETREG